MKKILITGANSYVGTRVEKWLGNIPNRYCVDTVDMEKPNWQTKDFSEYDVVFHVAGIAHVSTKRKFKDRYYVVNRDLAVEVAKKAKFEGVKQFIFMSSITVYGITAEVITKETVPRPDNHYGKSKLMAEERIVLLQDDSFKTVIIRSPMVYGGGSKGNYQRLSRFARKAPLFPAINNRRSMLHIDNLCEFIRLVIDNEETGVFYPQNDEYVATAEMVYLIAGIHGKKIVLTKFFNPLIRLGAKTQLLSKVFGNLAYEQTLSKYHKGEYCIRNLQQSIELTEAVKK